GLGGTADELLPACERALAETADERSRRLEQFAGVLSRTSWDSTAADMARQIENARPHRERHASRERQRPERSNSHPTAAVRRTPVTHASGAPVIVIGAGPTGLSAAYHLGEDSVLLEANDRVGGWCRSL